MLGLPAKTNPQPLASWKPCHPGVMRSGIENCFPAEPFEMPVRVIDQVIGVQDALVPAKNKVHRWNEGKVPSQPAIFRAEGIGKFHGRSGDKNLVMFIELGQNLLTVLDDR